MAFVSVPKDLTKVKNKVVLNLTKRQLICLSAAAAIGLPFYFLTREWIGTTNAATGMVLLMLPAFLFAMYEKDGLPLEKILWNIVTVKLIKPSVRRYEVENFYEMDAPASTRRKEGSVLGKREDIAVDKRRKRKYRRLARYEKRPPVYDAPDKPWNA